MKSNNIYIKPVGGLCNRMRTVDACVSLAQHINKKVTVIWGRDKFLNCKFSDLFISSKDFEVVEERQYLYKKALFPYFPGSQPVSFLKKKLYELTKTVLSVDKEIWFEDFNEMLIPLRDLIDLGQIQSMKDYETKAIDYFSPLVAQIKDNSNVFLCSAWRLWPEKVYKKRFIPVEHLNSKVNEIVSIFGHTIGVHIRRSDHSLSTVNSELDKFKEAINCEIRKNSDATFFLSTDCAQTEQELIHIYGDRIIIFKKQSYNRNLTQGIQDALVDLYCLSKTKKVFGSYFSSFSQVAADISGIDEIVIK